MAEPDLPPVRSLGRLPDPGKEPRLEFFEVQEPVRVTFRTAELQALCPAVSAVQPDIYDCEISYTALTHAIESKSLKQWLVTFRDRRIFAEHLAVELHDVISAFSPALADVRVRLVQNVRGGIVTTVEVPVPDPG